MKKIRHSKLPITLESTDNLSTNMLQAIEIQMTAYGWTQWIDEYGHWFDPYYRNTNQIELFDQPKTKTS